MGVSAVAGLLPFRRAVRLPERAGRGDVVLGAHGVGVSFGGVAVVAEVDLEVRSGEVVALVGPNGAGKSTLLAALAGDVDAALGRVTIDGEPLSHWSFVELAMRRGVLTQQVAMSFPFTVTQVVRMGRSPWAGTDAEDADDGVVRDALAATDVVHLAERSFTSLSGGERARAALARVLAQQPGVLLLDEPTAALDIRHQEQVLELARQRAVAGDAVVVVLHDLALAAAHADRIVVMARGRVVADGPPADVMTGERLSEVYEFPIETMPHPRTGELLVLPRRRLKKS